MRSEKGFSLIELLIVVAIILIIAAIAIPNLMRSRMTANQAAAASTVRTLNTTEVTYSTTYPTQGYAGSLVALGPGSSTCSGGPTYTQACLVDATLGCTAGTSGNYCQKDAYQYAITGIGNPIATDYVIFATPLGATSGGNDYCSDADAVVRFVADNSPPGTLLNTVAACQALGSL